MALFGRKKPVPEPAPEPPVEEPLPQRTVEVHLEAVLAGVSPLRPFGMQINDVSGLTLCEDIVSDLDLPMVSTATVDGYGVRAANIVGASGRHPIDLRILGVVDKPDELPALAVPPGGCALVSAGAPLPKGVDAVVPLADATRSGRSATFTYEAQVHQNVSLRGADLADGTPLLASGAVLDERSIAVLAEVGLDKVLVRPRPRLVVFSVGPDLLAPGLPVTAVNQRYASATPLVAAAARADGATVYPLDIVGRDAAALRQTLGDQAIRADAMVVLTQDETDAHVVADVLEGLGSVDLAHVLLGSGGAMPIGRLGDERLPVLALPADPVTAFAGYHLFVRPLLARLGARTGAAAPRGSARLAEPLPDAAGVAFVPGIVEDGQARPVTAGRALGHHLHRANALLVVPPGAARGPGASVEFVPLAAPTASE
nr:hypothetical protein [Propionibacterium sp.]